MWLCDAAARLILVLIYPFNVLCSVSVNPMQKLYALFIFFCAAMLLAAVSSRSVLVCQVSTFSSTFPLEKCCSLLSWHFVILRASTLPMLPSSSTFGHRVSILGRNGIPCLYFYLEQCCWLQFNLSVLVCWVSTLPSRFPLEKCCSLLY
jgi:hypothetical protein